MDRSAIQILEEAFHLLRSLDLRCYFVLFSGSVPFVLGLLYFAADMGRSSLAAESVLRASVVMTALYMWLRYAQACFCRGLWRTVQPECELVERPGEKFRQMAALFVIQAFQIPLLMIGLILLLPLGWIIAFLQNATVLAFTRSSAERSLSSLVADSLKFAHRDWAQNHGILLVVSFVTFFTWVNIVGTCLIVASFMKSFFGIESVFTISPLAAILNSSFALGTVLFTYLVISPILKAVYTLRCFYAQSRTTGEDLLSRLTSCRKRHSVESETKSIRKTPGSVAASILVLLSLPSM
ncbi:MAG: hypothetical protein AAF357_12580, partial [Verrucomicrobiota bacterium]